jgi:hypothetical protein
MRPRRDVLLTAGLLLLLVLITVGIGIFNPQTGQLPPLSSDSNAPDGTRALRLWLEELGYPLDNQPGETFTIPPNTKAVFILEPMLGYKLTKTDWKTLETWVQDGGVLLLASRYIQMDINGSTMQVDTLSVDSKIYPFSPAAPFFRSPPIQQPVNLSVMNLFKYTRSDILPLLTSSNGPSAIEVPHGKGRIILVADSDFLTNAGLKDSIHAALVLNLLSSLPSGSAIWIDEWHHGQRSATSTAAGPAAWLQYTPSGQALLFSAAVIFVALILAGRRFGRPVPLPRDQVRRAPLEHVTALANLNRRAGHNRALMQSYRTSLKRAYGQRYRLDSSLPDDLYVAQLARYNPALDAPALLDLLQRLNRQAYTESEIIHLAHTAATWINHIDH